MAITNKRKLDSLGVSAFCESMGMMLHSGIQTDEAVSLLQSGKAPSGGVLEEGLAIMQRKVNEGGSLAEAMQESGIFPAYALQMATCTPSCGVDISCAPIRVCNPQGNPSAKAGK